MHQKSCYLSFSRCPGFEANGVQPRDQEIPGNAQRAAKPTKNTLPSETAQEQRAKLRTRVMADATTTVPPKVKSSKPPASAFEIPKFEIPKFEIPKVEIPAAFREFAERGVAQAK